MVKNNSLNIGKWLSKITFITSTGDFTSLFVYGVIFSDIKNLAISAAITLYLKAFGTLAASLLFYFHSKKNFNYKNILIVTQVTLGLLTLLTLFLWFNNQLNIYSAIFVWVIQSFFAHLFSLTRESYSKFLEENHLLNENTSKNEFTKKKTSIWFVIQNEAGPMFGQSLGPIIFIILIHYFKFSMMAPLLFDALTFLIASAMVLKLPSALEKYDNLRPQSKLTLLKLFIFIFPIFITRVFILNSGLSIFNAIIFDLIPKNYNLHISYVGIVYSIIAIFSAITGAIINKLEYGKKRTMFCIGSLSYIAGALIFGYTNNIFLGIIGCIFVGSGNALQRIGSRSYIRELLNTVDHDRAMCIDSFAMKIIEIIVTILSIYYISHGLSTNFFVQLSCLFMFILCPMTLLWPSLAKNKIL